MQVDESPFGKSKKAGRGRSWKKVLIFGISGQVGCAYVMRRIFKPSKREIFPLLKKHVSSSCVVVHDGLAAYNDLPKDMGKRLLH